MPFFSLRSTKSSPSINTQTTSSEDELPNRSKERATSVSTGTSSKISSPKSSKQSPSTKKIVDDDYEEEHVNIEPTPLHPFLQTPKRSSRTSSLKTPTAGNSPPPPPLKLSSSFSPTNKYISSVHQYSRKRSNSMDATELAKTLDIYNAMKEKQLEEERRRQLLSSELDSSLASSSSSSDSSSSPSNTSSLNFSPLREITDLNPPSLLQFDSTKSSSSSDMSSDEEKHNLATKGDENLRNSPSPNPLQNPSSSPTSSDDESKKIPYPSADLNNVSRKEFKKLPHLRKRVARNSLKTQLEMSKEKEALELEKEAKKFASRSLTRWKPDFDSAGAAYEKAAAIFKALKQPAKAISCYTNSGECFYKCGIYYKSGQGFENAANLCKDTKDFNMAVDLYTKASSSYLDDGKGNRAGEALTKAAKMLAENGNIPQAIELYKSAVESLSMGGTYHNAMSTYRAYNDFLIRNSQWEEAISNCLEMNVGYKALSQNDNINKTCTSIILICLKMDDYVRADEYHKKFQSEHNSYGTSKESDISEDFLDAFERMDSNALETAKQNHHLKYLEASVFKMVSKLTLNGGMESSSQTRKPRQPKPIDAKKKSLLSHDESEDDEEHPASEPEVIPDEENIDDAFDPNDLT